MKCIIEISLDLAAKLESHGLDPIKILEGSIPETKRERETPANKNAVLVLSSLLSRGPVLSQIVMGRMHKAGVSRRALAYAKKKLKVTIVKTGFRGAWSWRLPAAGKDKKGAAIMLLCLYENNETGVPIDEVYATMSREGFSEKTVDTAVEFLGWSTRDEGDAIYLQTHNLR